VAGGQTQKLPIWLLDVHHFQDYLVDLMAKRVAMQPVDVSSGVIEDPEEDAGRPVWRLNGRDDHEYLRHMNNLHKVCRGIGSDMEWRWEPIREGVRVDYRAVEGYQVAAAEMMEVPILPPLATWRRHIEDQKTARMRPALQQRNEFLTSDGRAYLATER
jgi:hypothetical protein